MVEGEAGNGWSEYQRLVMAELERLDKAIAANRTHFDTRMDTMNDGLAGIRVEIATLRVKAGVWGAVAGMIPGAVILMWSLVKSSSA